MAVYGIDLGTTFSSVAYVERGVARVIPLESGRPTLASLCLFTAPHGQPAATVGTPALEAYRTLVGDRAEAPADVVLVRGAKNHIGVREASYAGPPWRVAGHDLYATDVSLRTLAEMVRGGHGLPPMEGVVVTHPQRFRNRERRAGAGRGDGRPARRGPPARARRGGVCVRPRSELWPAREHVSGV
jgi:molecular chaperone DnaK (HSP70)